MKSAITVAIAGISCLIFSEAAAQQPAPPAAPPAAAQAENATPAPAAGETGMAGVFEHTLITRVENGPETRWLFEADGLFTAEGPDGAVSRGQWTTEGPNTCIAPENGQRACVALVPPGARAGQSWTTRSAAGRQMTVQLVEGRE